MQQTIIPFLWFDGNAEEAANFYVENFKNSKVHFHTNYPKSLQEASGKLAGSIMTVCFELNGQQFIALNGGPLYSFTPAISFVIHCDDQDEIDMMWNKLISDGGREERCGWLVDKFGISWQVVPKMFGDLIMCPDEERKDRIMTAMLKMKKIIIKDLEEA